MTADGSFLVKEFYDLQKIKGVECQVLIMNNVVSGKRWDASDSKLNIVANILVIATLARLILTS